MYEFLERFLFFFFFYLDRYRGEIFEIRNNGRKREGEK